MSRITDGMASVFSCKSHNLSCRGKFWPREVLVTGLYVSVHSSCWLQNIWIHIYDMVLERWQRASRGVRCTALCRRSIFNRRWVCTRLIDHLKIALGTGSVLCQIALWDCFGDECYPSFTHNFLIVNEGRKWYLPQMSPTMQFDAKLTQSHSEVENGQRDRGFFP